jgi:hypothetical protein
MAVSIKCFTVMQNSTCWTHVLPVCHSGELEYMLRYKIKAEIEILHEAEAAGVSNIGSPSMGLPLVRYLAGHINSRLRLSSITGGTLIIE